MLTTQFALRSLRPPRVSWLPHLRFCPLSTTPPTRTGNSPPPPKPPIEEYIRQVREQHGDYLPTGLLGEKEYNLYERYFGRPTSISKEGENIQDIVKEQELDGRATVHNRGRIEIVSEEQFDSDNEELTADSELDLLEPIEKHTDMGNWEDFPIPSTPAEEELYSRVKQQVHRRGAESEDVHKEPEGKSTNQDSERWSSERLFHTHPLTSIGRFATYPTSIHVPEAVLEKTANIIADVAHSHLLDATRNALGGHQFAKSPIATSKRSKRVLDIPLDPTSPRMSDMDANVFFAAVMPGLYAQCLSSLTELRRRLGGDWVLGGQSKEHGVKNVLDVGSGGAGILAWRSVIEAEEARRKDEDSQRTGKLPPEASGKSSPAGRAANGLRAIAVTGSSALRERMAKLLDNTTFIPRIPSINFDSLYHPPKTLPDTNSQPRKPYDLIIATNRLLPVVKHFNRRQIIDALWSHLNPEGGVLLIIEKGTPMGFEAVAGARATILKNYIASAGAEFQPAATDATTPSTPKEAGAIISPCTNHDQCPMFHNGPTDGTSRKDYCRFSQRYSRPSYLQKLMQQKAKNHETLEYSYVSFRRGVDYRQDDKNTIIPKLTDFNTTLAPSTPGAPIESPYTTAQLRAHSFTLPRVILPPIKRPGHVILDVCTPTAQLERWTVPRSLGKTEFHDARKSSWGDLWGLGAKTRVPRNVKLGSGYKSNKPRLIAITDGYGGVKAIVKDQWGTSRKKAKREKKEEAREGRLALKAAARERHEEVVRKQKEKKERERMEREVGWAKPNEGAGE